jgi:Nucleotidyltransferase domain
VAKLRSVLAVQSGVFASPPSGVGMPVNTRQPTHASRQFDLPFTPESFPIAPRARTMAAMSDAGHRVDNESTAGADDDALGKLHSQDPRHVSSSATVAESDASLDPSTVYNIYQMPVGVQNVRQIQDPIAPHGIRSRLSDDIAQFIDNIETKLNKLESTRRMAIERMTRLVESVWPRAQVNLYGSHATGLCIPSSDLDFVVCLPAVHKNAVAVAPGVLEGRNAINESSQKLLARRLKSESWIDPRSMKIIERTTTPVIKVATKDTKAKTLHLDISFEGPGHHGLEAARMIASVTEEIPCVRPLCLVLKQFLIDRGLLEAYTGKFWLLRLAYVQLTQSYRRRAEFVLFISYGHTVFARAK